MLRDSVFDKRFSVGLTLDATLAEFEHFLAKYGRFIQNIYFSLPMGDKFHSRENVVRQMRDKKNVRKLWKMLSMAAAAKIELELVLNNGNVTDQDIRRSRELLEKHAIAADIVGITHDIYDNIKRVFPEQKIVYSFNNRTNKPEDFEKIAGKYDSVVIGRQNIRNSALFANICRESETVLLLNNGCSHICGGCSTLANCHGAYYKAKLLHSPEYLYALQSVMPFEIHEELLDISRVRLFKISSRNAPLSYLADCMESYIYCKEDEYIAASAENYILWGRLAWHAEFYDTFSLERIRAFKRNIYAGKKNFQPSYAQICADLRNRYLFGEGQSFSAEGMAANVKRKVGGIPFTLKGALIGIPDCSTLLRHVSVSAAEDLLDKLKSCNLEVSFELPPCAHLHMPPALLGFLTGNAEKIDCFVVNDEQTEEFVKAQFNRPVAYGLHMSFNRISAERNTYESGNENGYGNGIISPVFRERLRERSVAFLLCEMPENGLCISAGEDVVLKVHLELWHECVGICCSGPAEECGAPCLRSLGTRVRCFEGQERILLPDALCATVKTTEGVIKTIKENRAEWIVEG